MSSMIPELPEGMVEEDVLDFYDKLSGNLTDQSTIHVHWWTHRQNPSVCWICDMVTLLSKILDITNKNITKSTVDIETYDRSENNSEPEIETSNYDDENHGVPEYDVENDTVEESRE